MELLKLIYRISYLFVQTFKDIVQLVKSSLKSPNYNDKEISISRMRHLAHMLEKTLENPDKEDVHRKHDKNRYDELDMLIKKWDDNGHDMYKADVRWIKKIFHEFTMNIESDWYCVLLKTKRGSIQGVKEINEQNDSNSQTAEINLMQLLKGRRSVRSWKNDMPKKEKIDAILEAGLWAPSSCNRQTTRYIVVQDKNLIKLISSGGKGVRSFFEKAPLLILIMNDSRPYSLPDEKFIIYQDGAAAIQNMLIMAQRIGIGACWGSFVSDSAQIVGERKIRKVLNVPSYIKFTGVLGVGDPDMMVCKIARKNVNEATSWK